MISKKFGDIGTRKVRVACWLLRDGSEEDAYHAADVLKGVVPGNCGKGATACTSGPHGRYAVLSFDPISTSIVEIAISIAHESWHYDRDENGILFIVEHECNDCSDPIERSLDSFYQAEDELREKLYRFLRSGSQKALEIQRLDRALYEEFEEQKRALAKRGNSNAWGAVVTGGLVGLGLAYLAKKSRKRRRR